jgi:diguanylate cyclase (GGDEF)-like protein
MTTTVLTGSELESTLAGLPDNVPVALALTDIDFLKELNAEHGRKAGDAVLGALERALLANVPADALVARISGDEYAVALPGANAETALILLEEIRAHFSAHPPTPELDAAVSLSIGVASRPQHAKTVEDLLRAAGEALYRAKVEGRGRVAIYVEDKMTLKSNYYSKATLVRLAKLSAATHRTEASLLREGLDDLLGKYKDEL